MLKVSFVFARVHTVVYATNAVRISMLFGVLRLFDIVGVTKYWNGRSGVANLW